MKTPEPQKGNPSAPSSADSTGPTIKLTPRQHRALVALVDRATVPCKELGAIGGQNNFGELAASLRRKLGYDAIVTGVIENALDRDGQPCKPGFYALSPKGRERAVALLGGARRA